ncbi:OmpA family protein [Volucribacter amazonae]|uniref:OmpA-like domain-containing protein n=1 Tax=Volucribacter amazonae TaxID=256731 RepID=A0A9X4PBZ2_9PAST|nr:OmpA family protein [Volucribacter amazonae]MDG6894751.1 hypothetical protein [Volucribacter amazonae]
MIELAQWTYRETRTTGITEYLTQQAITAEQAALNKQSIPLFTPASPGYPRLALPQRERLTQLAQQRGVACAPKAFACADVALLGLEYESQEGYGDYRLHGEHFAEQAKQYLGQIQQGILHCPSQTEHIRLDAEALFKFGQWHYQDILPQGQQSLQEFAARMTKQGSRLEQVIITGHTDRIGSEQSNQLLSQRRAETVAQYLRQSWQQQGLNLQNVKIIAQGKGENEPLVQCQAQPITQLKACLQPNRRVEIQVNYAQSQH